MQKDSKKKKVLITGANSFIGETFINYIKENYPGELAIDVIDMKQENWKKKDFTGYDAVFHVAGIAHVDNGKLSKEKEILYYKVNRDLTVEVAEKAKKEGVRQFIFMSSAIIYGKAEYITKETKPNPVGYYGDSKWQAEKRIQQLAEYKFCVAIVRPPMIYGKGCKGNYPILAKIARVMPIFPKVKNKRSMLYIENLCEFLYQLIKSRKEGIFFPQNREYVNTSQMVMEIARVNGHKIWVTSLLNPFVSLFMYVPGKIGRLCKKAFGSNYYDFKLENKIQNYQKYNFQESIKRTEG